MSTIVFHSGALGDSVLAWPLLRAVAPAAFITSLPKARLAARWLPGVEPVDGDSPEFSRLFAGGAAMEVGDALRARLGGAARIISFISDGADPWAANVRSLARGAELVCIAQRPPEDHPTPIVRWQTQQLEAHGVHMHPQFPARRLNPDGPVIVHPGSGGPRKVWPAGRFRTLFEHFANMGRELIVLFGEVERERPPEQLQRWQRDFDVRQPANLIELSEIVSRAAVFIGNDSGPTHLAAALGVATVAMFGPTDPRTWAPVGPAVTVLWPGAPAPMDWLSVEEVAAAAARW